MTYDGITIHRDWLEQARLMFQSDTEVGKAVLALLDYALYDKEYNGRSKLIQAYIIGVQKRVQSQRKRYAQLKKNRASYTNTNTNTNTITTSDKDEEERKRLLERLKNQNK